MQKYSRTEENENKNNLILEHEDDYFNDFIYCEEENYFNYMFGIHIEEQRLSPFFIEDPYDNYLSFVSLFEENRVSENDTRIMCTQTQSIKDIIGKEKSEIIKEQIINHLFEKQVA
ncbi:MAG: hypothetical protein NT068_01630 [Candidatus Nomurabacteria bacterium]|nr:hypothetical protein [Candidatus Nomurabacteria bacterium]